MPAESNSRPTLPDFTVGRLFLFEGRTVEVFTAATFSNRQYRVRVIDGGQSRLVLAASLSWTD